jgi:hypothetical protein
VSHANGNGSQPSLLDDAAQAAEAAREFRYKMINQARDQIAAEEALREPYVEAITASQDRERDARAILRALKADDDAKPTANRKGGGKGWTISDAKVAQVWEIIRAREDATFTASQLVAPGLSSESVRRSIEILRRQELLRRAGSTRGGGTLWALMPDARDVVDPTAAG